jgi:hypothetical protein
LRRQQLATAAILIVIAAVAMFDTRSGALPDTTGGAPGGLKGGWYPFWSAALAAMALAVVAYRAATTVQKGDPFGGREGITTLLKLLLPIVVLVVVMDRLLGFYLAGALYLAWFARAISGYRWIWAVLPALVIPTLLYFTFESFFKVSLPKSIWFTQGLPF